MFEGLKNEERPLCKLETSIKGICNRFELSDLGKSSPDTDNKILFINHLTENKLYPDAINFLAHGLPQREAIWWAYLCAEQMNALSPNKHETELLMLIKAWIYRPEEERRRAIEPFPEKLEFKTPASWVAQAVFWSGGSITPLGQALLEAPEYLYAKALSGAIMLSAVVIPEKMEAQYQQFLAMGVDIAMGGSGGL